MNTLSRRFGALIAPGVAALMLFASPATFAAEPVNTLEKQGLLSGYKTSGIAIRGYDTVAYWTEGAPREGTAEFATDWMGATWQFASADNMALFEGDPERYAPQYGGYCAFGVAQDALVKIEPENWSIVDDKLYLNYNDSVQSQWNADVPGFIAQADAKFEALLASE